MITKWYKNILACILQAGVNKGFIPTKDITGATKYQSGLFGPVFPSSPGNVVQINTSTNTGIWIGTGSTPATEDDYNIENRITSGLSSNTPAVRVDVDGDGNPYIEYTFMLSNSTGNDIVVSEIGYIQTTNASTAIGGSTNTIRVLIDRTVLPAPVTVSANGEAVIKYTLKTIQAI